MGIRIDFFSALYSFAYEFKYIADWYLYKRGINKNTNILYLPEKILDKLDNYMSKKVPGYMKYHTNKYGITTMTEKGRVQRLHGLMIPQYNEHGSLYGLTFRNVYGKDKWRYKNTRCDMPLPYNCNNISVEEDLYIVEGAMDCLSMIQMGYKNCVGLSRRTVTKPYLDFLKKFKKRIILCFDNDDAGKKGVKDVYFKLVNSGIKDIVIAETKGEDPNDYLLNQNENDFIINTRAPRIKINNFKTKRGIDKKAISWYNKQISIKDILNHLGIRGTGYQYQCPFPDHTDKQPSFILYPDGGFSCHGCGRGGKLFSFLRHMFGFSIEESIDWLNENILKERKI
ncbi:MAG: toprim domain-containing protein [Candidatus Omnitrophica bacterium]|nr:toprim domain-containing protein [Candidatus Omnitrophota bacterium]